MYIHAHTHTTHTYMHAYTCTRKHACMHTYIHTCMHACMQTYVYKYIYYVKVYIEMTSGRSQRLLDPAACHSPQPDISTARLASARAPLRSFCASLATDMSW